MNSRKIVRDALGLTQQEMASLLKINRAQYSMYESCLRELPMGTSSQLKVILQHLNSPADPISKKITQVAKQETLVLKELEKQLKECRHQQQLIARKLADMEPKYTTQVAILQLVDFLRNHQDTAADYPPVILNLLESKAERILAKNGLPLLAQLQRQQALLEHEAAWFKKEVAKYGGEKIEKRK